MCERLRPLPPPPRSRLAPSLLQQVKQAPAFRLVGATLNPTMQASTFNELIDPSGHGHSRLARTAARASWLSALRHRSARGVAARAAAGVGASFRARVRAGLG